MQIGKKLINKSFCIVFIYDVYFTAYLYLIALPSSIQLPFQFLKALQGALEIFDDVVGKRFGIGEIVEVGEGFVLDPEDVETRLVTLQYLIDAKSTPTTVGILFRPCFHALIAVRRIIT